MRFNFTEIYNEAWLQNTPTDAQLSDYTLNDPDVIAHAFERSQIIKKFQSFLQETA